MGAVTPSYPAISPTNNSASLIYLFTEQEIMAIALIKWKHFSLDSLWAATLPAPEDNRIPESQGSVGNRSGHSLRSGIVRLSAISGFADYLCQETAKSGTDLMMTNVLACRRTSNKFYYSWRKMELGRLESYWRIETRISKRTASEQVLITRTEQWVLGYYW